MKIKPLEFKETYDSTVKTCWEAKGVTYKYEITQTDLGFGCIKIFSKDIQNNLKYPTFQQALDFCNSENLKDFIKVIESCESVKKTWVIKDDETPQSKRKIKYIDGEIHLFTTENGEDNPCNCGANVYYVEMQDDFQYGICNNCGSQIYEITEPYDTKDFK